jgi:hypothetical protein
MTGPNMLINFKFDSACIPFEIGSPHLTGHSCRFPSMFLVWIITCDLLLRLWFLEIFVSFSLNNVVILPWNTSQPTPRTTFTNSLSVPILRYHIPRRMRPVTCTATLIIELTGNVVRLCFQVIDVTALKRELMNSFQYNFKIYIFVIVVY